MSEAKSSDQAGQAAASAEVADHLAGSPVTGIGYLTGPGLVDFPVTYANVAGTAIYAGCIDMGPVDEVATAAVARDAELEVLVTTVAAGSEDGGEQMGVGLPQTSDFLWTSGRVAWTVDANVPNQQRITDAVNHIEQNTGIRFTRRTAANASSWPNYIRIISNGSESWSSSAIGMRGGEQLLRLADGHPWGVLVHEFLHALGVYHEQSRSDRDNFVEVKWSNIQDGPPPAGEIDATGNFQKQPGATDYFDYDYGSIMHYGPRSFAKDSSQPTLVPKQSGVTIGQRAAMSFGDRQTVAKMYERSFTKGWSGVFRAGTGAYALWANATWEDFQAKWQAWSGQGLRLVDIHVRSTASGPRWSGVFVAGSGPYGLWAGASWDSFRAKWQEWSGQGLRLHDLHVHRVNGTDRYSGVFLAGSGRYGLWAGASWDSFRAKRQEWSGQGLRLHDLHVHQVGGSDRYSGVFLAGSGGHGLWAGASWSSFIAKWQEWSGQGLRLVSLNTHRAGSETRWSGAFLPGTDSYILWSNVTWESFRAKWEEAATRGLRLIDIEFVNPPAGQFLDAAGSGLDLGAADTTAHAGDDDRPFGGIVEAVVPPRSATEPAGGGDGEGGTGGSPALAASASGTVAEDDADGRGGAQLASNGTASADSGDGGAVLDVGAEEQDVVDGLGDVLLPNGISSAGNVKIADRE